MDTNFMARGRRKSLGNDEGEHALKQTMTWLLVAAIGALLQSATLAFAAHPFGVALAAATTDVFFPAAALGVAAFALFTGDYLSVAALGILAALRILISVLSPKDEKEGRVLFFESAHVRALVVAAVMLLVRFYALWRGEFRVYYLFALLVSVGIAPLATLLLAPLFEEEEGDSVRDIGLAALFFLCLFAMRSVSFFGIYPAAVAAALAAFWLSAHRGVLYGALGGGLFGIAIGLLESPVFLLCGLGFGLLERSSRGGGILVGGGLGSLYAFTVLGTTRGMALLPAVLTAGALFLAGDSAGIVEGAAKRLLFARRRAAEAAAKNMTLDWQASHMREVSAAFSDLSSMLYDLGGRVRRPGRAELGHLCDREFDRVCPDCPHRALCWGSEYQSTVESLSLMAERLQRGERASTACMSPSLVERCPSLSLILGAINDGAQYLCEEALRHDQLTVVARDLSTVARVFSQTLEHSERAFAVDRETGEKIVGHLQRQGYTLDSVTVCRVPHCSVLIRGLRLSSRHIKMRDLRALLQRCCEVEFSEGVTMQTEGAPDILFCERTSLCVTTVKATRAGREEESYCGDSVASFETESGRAYAFLCDGMGSGNSAALTSALSGAVLGKLLRAGVCADTALRMLSAVLLSRGRRQNEQSTTVDLLEIDRVTGEASLFKCGAAPTYLLRGGATTRFCSRTAPIGILELPDAERLRFHVESGDVIVQVSDGVTGGDEDCPWLADMLVSRYDGDADRFAQNVLAHAAANGNDDLSIVVTEIRASESAA